MQKLCIFGMMTAFSYLGWYLGSLIGEFMTAFFVSSLFSLIGVFFGWWLWQRYFR